MNKAIWTSKSSCGRRLAALGFVSAALLCSAALPAGALALLPTVNTGPATQVSYERATLNGAVNPKGSETYYYFQYGPTRAYGSQTGILDAGSGVKGVAVSIAISGLQPLTRYHYRLVAVNGTGAAVGGDRSFLTPKIPLSLQILVSPNPVPYGFAATIQGTLTGTGNANRQVELQANAFPFTAGFAMVGNPELTNAQGGFSFNVLGLTAATQYRVVAVANPPVSSPVAAVSVNVRMSAHAKRVKGRIVKGRRRVRFYGTTVPQLNGTHVAIIRVVHGQNITVAGTVLHAGKGNTSRFSRVVRVRRGVYRVLVAAGGALTPSYSDLLVVR